MNTIIIYGDSIAAGFFKGKVSTLLDDYVLDSLSAQDMDNFKVLNFGVPKDSTQTAKDRLSEIEALRFEYLVVNVGINDAINIQNNEAEYKDNIKKILTPFSNKKCVLLGPSYVDIQKKPQASHEAIKKYNKFAKDLAEELEVSYIDVYKEMIMYHYPKDLLQDDGLHPSKFGYHFLATLIAKAIADHNH